MQIPPRCGRKLRPITAHLHQIPESVVIERWRTEHGRGTRRRRRNRQHIENGERPQDANGAHWEDGHHEIDELIHLARRGKPEGRRPSLIQAADSRPSMSPRIGPMRKATLTHVDNLMRQTQTDASSGSGRFAYQSCRKIELASCPPGQE